MLMSDNFVIKECNSDNDNCLIKCLETAFLSDNIKMEKKYIHKKLVKNIKALKDNQFIDIIKGYIITFNQGYKRYCDPRSILKQKELANLVEEEEFFEGNDLATLYMISVCFGVEFLVFNESFKAKVIGNQPSIIYLFYDSKKGKYNIIGLKYYKKDKIITQALFHKNDLPSEIEFLRNIKAYLLEKAKRVFFKAMENKESFAMDELVKRVEDDIYFPLDDNYRKQLEEVMIRWLTK